MPLVPVKVTPVEGAVEVTHAERVLIETIDLLQKENAALKARLAACREEHERALRTLIAACL